MQQTNWSASDFQWFKYALFRCSVLFSFILAWPSDEKGRVFSAGTNSDIQNYQPYVVGLNLGNSACNISHKRHIMGGNGLHKERTVEMLNPYSPFRVFVNLLNNWEREIKKNDEVKVLNTHDICKKKNISAMERNFKFIFTI